MQSIQDTAAFRGTNRYGRAFTQLDIRRQIVVIIDVLGMVHAKRHKTTGFTTKKFRAHIVNGFITEVREAGYNVRSLLNLDQRHIQAAVDTWIRKELAAATIQTRLSALRWLTSAIGKPGMIRMAEHYGLRPEHVERSGVATEDRSWSAKGQIAANLIATATELDPWVGAHLSLMSAFGLRPTEAILIRPRAAHIGDVLRVEEGTKGGRTRILPVRTAEQLAVLEVCKQISDQSLRGALVHPDRTPAQQRRRLYYVCEKLGITKNQLEITPHGLRHEYANDRYEEVSGTESVVRGSSAILDEAAEDRARRTVTEELGHRRTGITASYTGRSKRRLAGYKRPAGP